jgi:WS/DGAT/MGAT family acyltransferase
MQRLSLLDSQFLHLEDECAPLHIAATCVFDGPVPSRAEIRAHVRRKLPRIPRYRQRLKFLPLELGRPLWVDDVHFDLDFHVRRTALPAPGDEQALCELVGHIMSSTLDRTRPLWELWTVEGLSQGRWALVVKVHHSMVDGVSGVDLLQALLDPRREASEDASETAWQPEPEPTRASMLRHTWQGLAQDAQGWMERLRAGLEDPERLRRSVLDNTQGLLHWMRHLTPTRPLSIEGSVGGRRVYAFHRAPLEKLMAVRKAAGGTLNDVILAAVAGGYRRFLQERGECVDEAELRTLVPVSVRAPDQHDQLGNRVSAILCELPVAEPDPLRRLQQVREHMDEHKRSHMAEAGDWLVSFGNLAPPMLVGPLTRLIARAMRTLPQRALNTVVTNVPGPRTPLYLLGRKQLAVLPYVPIHHGARTAIAVLSYQHEVCFGITADYDSAPDARLLAESIGIELEALASACGAPLAQPSTCAPAA